MVDAVSKRERGNGTKRVKAANKRSKRTACSTERDMLPLEVISETDSLSSLTDDNLKRASNNASEEEGERLREPVLLKLAKSDCHCNQFEGCKPTLPKIDEDSKPSHTDRSVWSIVYNRDQNALETNQKSDSPLLPSKKGPNDSPFLLDSGNVYKPVDVSDRGTNSLPTQKCSSYPPTPSISPHVPSPATSIVSDDLVASSSHSLRPETGVSLTCFVTCRPQYRYLYLDEPFDPLTQCGCLEVDDFKCKNSLLCTVHTMDEKRQVPRRKDLRILMREARERLQLSRQAQTVHRQAGHNFSDMDVPQTVIDLTDDFSGPGGGTEVMVDGSEEDRLRLRFLSSNSSHQRQRMMYRRISDETRAHFGLNRSRLIDPAQSGSHNTLCFPTRLARRVPNRDGSFSILPGVSYVGDTNDHLYASPCPNITIGGSGEHFIAMRQNSVPNEAYLNESSSVNTNEMPVGQLPGRYLALPRRQISTAPVSTNSVKRQQQQRQHQELRRAQLASFQPVQQHWTSSVDSHSTLMGCSSTIDPLAAPLMEDSNDTSLSASTELMLPETSQVLGCRGSVVESSYGAQVLPGVADPMLITPSSISSLSYNVRTMTETQTPHLLPLLNQPVMVNRFARSMYSGTQFVREPQACGRVIVDDMREKSITGRSRKTAKSTIRHAGQVFTRLATWDHGCGSYVDALSPIIVVLASNFTGLLSSRFQSAVAQPQSSPAFLASGRKPNTSVDLFKTRPTVISRTVLQGGSTSDLFPGPTACVNNDSVGSIRASSFGPHNLLKPPRFAPKHGPLGFGGTGVVASTASAHTVESTPHSDAIDLDYCIQASSFITTTSTTHSTSSSIQTTADPPEPNDTLNCVTFTNQEPYVSASRSVAVPAAVAPQSANVSTPESAPLLCRNRYFVIRPNSIKRSPGVVLRTKRPEVCSFQQTPAHKQHPSDNSQ
ncbi:uncharacterized protein DEA37_0008417 [Paragonimus westermani]|uniref:SCA7 domain-containing protein n=1 Tax=Paragonimus westermani TaxID=34504 RepID=A0A5J4NZA0_9TREM|nr:uncharacterized protein DEA37_0008417 [Paragonimus westermani]